VGFSVAIVVAIFAYAIPKFANYGSMWAILRTLTWPQLGLLAAATLFNLVTYWAQLMAWRKPVHPEQPSPVPVPPA
jgi:hypothetical protein